MSLVRPHAVTIVYGSSMYVAMAEQLNWLLTQLMIRKSLCFVLIVQVRVITDNDDNKWLRAFKSEGIHQVNLCNMSLTYT